MAFGLGKLAVLESKLNIYEDLSKEMLDKLERAVGTISESSNRVAVILERHENRLDEGDKTNEAIIKMIDARQQSDEKMFDRISKKFDEIEKKINDLYKFRWITVGVLTTILVLSKTIDLMAPSMIGPLDTLKTTWYSNTTERINSR